MRIVARYSSTRCGLGYVNDMSVGIGLLSTTCSVKERSPVLAPGHLINAVLRPADSMARLRGIYAIAV